MLLSDLEPHLRLLNPLFAHGSDGRSWNWRYQIEFDRASLRVTLEVDRTPEAGQARDSLNSLLRALEVGTMDERLAELGTQSVGGFDIGGRDSAENPGR